MRLITDPLLHFVVLGALTFGVIQHFDPGSHRYEIDAGARERARLAAMYRQQYGTAPTADELQKLLDQYVRGEILYREGLAMGLAQGDEIVRRRVIQKVEFLNEDLDVPPAPGRAALREFFRQHEDRYESAATVSFTQIYFSADRDGEAAARRRAERALHGLQSGEPTLPEGLSDAFADGAVFSSLSAAGAAAVFGSSPMTTALSNVPLGTWSGPLRSGLGWHLIQVTSRQPAGRVTFETAEDRVRADYLAALREQRNRAAFRRIASKYRVIADEPRA